MRIYGLRTISALLFCLTIPWNCLPGEDQGLPEFGQDTVLVWETKVQNTARKFVVRIARYSPDLIMEWEDALSQGTVFISNRDLLEAKGYLNNDLFQQGMDTRADGATTMWLSRSVFRTLKEKKSAKCKIDRVPGKITYEGDGVISVQVNGSPMTLPVIKVHDDRKAEKWFLDNEENPLLMKYTLRHHNQTLVSITTDRPNTLRWLKGSKLQRLLNQ